MAAEEEGEEEEEGAAEGGVGITSHDELIQQYQELADRQKKLAAEVAKVKGLPLAGEKMEVGIARLHIHQITEATEPGDIYLYHGPNLNCCCEEMLNSLGDR